MSNSHTKYLLNTSTQHKSSRFNTRFASSERERETERERSTGKAGLPFALHAAGEREREIRATLVEFKLVKPVYAPKPAHASSERERRREIYAKNYAKNFVYQP